VTDAGVRRHDPEVIEGLLRPPQQLITLLVAVELQLGVAAEGVGAAEDVGDDGVVDDQLGRDERVDPARVAAEIGHGVTHRHQIHHTRHPGEVLQQHPRRRELDLGALGVRIPGAERVNLLGGHQRTVLMAQQVLQQHLQAEGQPRRALQAVQPEHLVRQLADREPVTGARTVPCHALLRPFACDNTGDTRARYAAAVVWGGYPARSRGEPGSRVTPVPGDERGVHPDPSRTSPPTRGAQRRRRARQRFCEVPGVVSGERRPGRQHIVLVSKSSSYRANPDARGTSRRQLSAAVLDALRASDHPLALRELAAAGRARHDGPVPPRRPHRRRPGPSLACQSGTRDDPDRPHPRPAAPSPLAGTPATSCCPHSWSCTGPGT
jgi:hypothetical protein